MRLGKRKRLHDLKGVAAAEFAVCLPVLVLLLLGMLESCAVIFLKQSLAIAAYEGAHRGVRAGATTAGIQTVCTQVLADRRVQDGSVQILPADISTVPKGAYFEIRVSAPTTRNSLLASRFFRGMTMTSSARMMKEE